VNIGVLLFFTFPVLMYSDVSLTAVYLHVYVFGGDWHFPEVRCSFIGPTERQALDML